MIPRPVMVLVLAIAIATATLWLGWWTLPVLGVMWGLRFRPIDAAASAVLGWGGLLVWQSTRGPVAVLADRLSGIFSLPAWAVLALSPLFAALLGWSAAAVSKELVGRTSPRRKNP